MHGFASARGADLGMELTLHKCKVLIPGLSQDEANHAIRSAISSHPELSSLSDMVSDDALACIVVGDRAITIADVVKIDDVFLMNCEFRWGYCRLICNNLIAD